MDQLAFEIDDYPSGPGKRIFKDPNERDDIFYCYNNLGYIQRLYIEPGLIFHKLRPVDSKSDSWLLMQILRY